MGILPFNDLTNYTMQTGNVGIISYGFAIISKLTGFDQVAFRILDLNAIIFPAYVFVVVIKRSRQNYRSAIFFLLI